MLTSTKISKVYRTTAEIGELVEAFEHCTLPREKWTHAAYLTVMLWYLHLNSLSEARQMMRNSIKRYDFEHNIAAAESNGYNETLTVFWLGAINGFLKRYGDFYSLAEMANQLIAHFADKNLPLKFYSREQLFSTKAKSVWIEPDKFIQDRKIKGANLYEKQYAIIHR